MAAHKFLV
uniref:Uncharacterized protein n=1 Tax=Anguilla anguilla TaxID=7936 RepID=A0A0E9VGV5_ANGAN